MAVAEKDEIVDMVDMLEKGRELFKSQLKALGDQSAYLEHFLGVQGWVDGLQEAARLAISISKRGPIQNSTDQEKTEMIVAMLQDKELGELSEIFAKDCLRELCMRHNNLSTRLTDSPEDIPSRVERIVIDALEQYLQYLNPTKA